MINIDSFTIFFGIPLGVVGNLIKISGSPHFWCYAVTLLRLCYCIINCTHYRLSLNYSVIWKFLLAGSIHCLIYLTLKLSLQPCTEDFSRWLIRGFPNYPTKCAILLNFRSAPITGIFNLFQVTEPLDYKSTSWWKLMVQNAVKPVYNDQPQINGVVATSYKSNNLMLNSFCGRCRRVVVTQAEEVVVHCV